MSDYQTQEGGAVLLPAANPEPRRAALAAPAASGPMAMLEIAVRRGAGVEELDKLMQLAQRFEDNEARKSFVVAMAEFKKVPPRVEKTRRAKVDSRKGEGASYAYKYANVADVCEAVVGRLAECGISHSWSTKQQDGHVHVTCTLTHERGHSSSTSLSSGLDTSGGKNALQALGSAVSYLERYTLLAACGIAVDDEQDDDAAGVTPDEREELRGAARDMRQQRRSPKPDEVAARYTQQQGPDEALLGNARKAADGGRAAFDAFWKSINGAQRTALGGNLDDLAARCDIASKKAGAA